MTTPDAANSLIHASTVRDTPVFSADGDRIGHVEDISIDKRTGEVAYAVLAAGGFLGMGERLHPVPWSILKYDTRLNGYVVPLNKDRLREAPSFEREELADAGEDDRGYRDPVFGYYGPYGAQPFWN
jgi:sporulation protein YlmC with PRC-barrel domain